MLRLSLKFIHLPFRCGLPVVVVVVVRLCCPSFPVLLRACFSSFALGRFYFMLFHIEHLVFLTLRCLLRSVAAWPRGRPLCFIFLPTRSTLPIGRQPKGSVASVVVLLLSIMSHAKHALLCFVFMLLPVVEESKRSPSVTCSMCWCKLPRHTLYTLLLLLLRRPICFPSELLHIFLLSPLCTAVELNLPKEMHSASRFVWTME